MYSTMDLMCGAHIRTHRIHIHIEIPLRLRFMKRGKPISQYRPELIRIKNSREWKIYNGITTQSPVGSVLKKKEAKPSRHHHQQVCHASFTRCIHNANGGESVIRYIGSFSFDHVYDF